MSKFPKRMYVVTWLIHGEHVYNVYPTLKDAKDFRSCNGPDTSGMTIQKYERKD